MEVLVGDRKGRSKMSTNVAGPEKESKYDTRDWGTERVFFNKENPSSCWISITTTDLINLEDYR